MINRPFALSMFVCSTLAAACASGASPAPTFGPSLAPTGVASPAAGATSGGASAAATIPNIGGDGNALAAGTYTVSLDRIVVSGAKLPPIQVTVPDGWDSGGWLIDQPRAGQDRSAGRGAVLGVDQVYKDPVPLEGCAGQPGSDGRRPGLALVAQSMRNATGSRQT